MAEITAKKNRRGEVIGYFVRCNLGRDEHGKKIRASTTLPHPTDKNGKPLTPKRAEKEIARQAENWEKEQRDIFEKGRKEATQTKVREKNNITLSEFIDKRWMAEHVKDGEHTPKTISFYTEISTGIKEYFDSVSPNLKLRDICTADIRAYIGFLKKDAKKKNGEHLSKTTIQHYYNALRNILNYAVYEEFIPDNPCLKIKPKDRPKKENHEIDFLKPDEAVRFVECLDSEKEAEWWKQYHHRSPLMWKCLCNVLITTGLRRGEAIGLQWSDLGSDKTLHVQRNITIDTSNKASNEAEDKIHIGLPKTKVTRIEPISAYLYELLIEFKNEQEKRYGVRFISTESKPVNSTAYIFCRDVDLNLPLYPTEVTRLLSKYIKRHDLRDVSPHDLRHSAASLAIESGANVKQIQHLLGHADVGTSLKFYAEVTERAKQSTVEGIENLIRPKPPEKKSEQA